MDCHRILGSTLDTPLIQGHVDVVPWAAWLGAFSDKGPTVEAFLSWLHAEAARTMQAAA